MNNDISVIIGLNYRHIANAILPQFIKDNEEDIVRVIKSAPFRVDFKNGMKTYFVSDYDYPTWCKGRTYYIGGKKYRSGYEIEV